MVAARPTCLVQRLGAWRVQVGLLALAAPLRAGVAGDSSFVANCPAGFVVVGAGARRGGLDSLGYGAPGSAILPSHVLVADWNETHCAVMQPLLTEESAFITASAIADDSASNSTKVCSPTDAGELKQLPNL